MLLTVDIGTSIFKTAVWDFDGNRLSSASIPVLAEPDAKAKYEFECSAWLRAFEYCCNKLKNIAGAQAIIISGNGPTLVPVTAEPTVKSFELKAANARLWLDRRTVKYQQQVSDIKGGFVDASFFLPKILGIKNDENGLYKKTRYFLGCPEYLACALSGQARTVIPSDGFERWFWNESDLQKLNLDAGKFPPFIRPGEAYGEIRSSVSKKFGFKKNIPVIAGGPDFYAAIIGSGVIKPGQVCDRSGSSEGINLCTEKKFDMAKLMSYGHPVKPFWNLSGVISTTGKALEWCRDLLRIKNFKDLFSLASKSESGSGGLVFNPYLAGERAPIWDPDARAVWRGINLNTGQAELARSVLEGICFAIRDVISVMEETGVKAGSLRVTGGLADNDFLNQIKANVTGKQILQPEHKEAELLGLAIIGSCFLGKYDSFAQASEALISIKKSYEPELKYQELYNRLFHEYKKK
jgi:xylulokinase